MTTLARIAYRGMRISRTHEGNQHLPCSVQDVSDSRFVPDPDPKDLAVLSALQERDGTVTEVELIDGQRLTVVNIAWGYDMGDRFSHITTNMSPTVDGLAIDFFYSSSVVQVIDPATKTIIL